MSKSLDLITLDVGGTFFKSRRETLEQSPFLKRLLSDQWNSISTAHFYLELDPTLFEHVLSYLRQPDALPVFYNAREGFDYGLYNRLGAAADYLGISDLADWIENKRYLQVVTMRQVIRYKGDIAWMPDVTLAANETERVCSVTRVNRIYLCPREIGGHKGHPELCGKACKARGEREGWEWLKEEYVHVTCVVTKVLFNQKVCRLSSNEEDVNGE